MLEWPGRCSRCQQIIEDWASAGSFAGRWIHKHCWQEEFLASSVSTDPPALRSPLERSSQLELPMLIFLLLFHFGIGLLVMGWIMLDQGRYDTTGTILVAIGIITPLMGVAGIALNVAGRRRIEQIRQSLDSRGGWKPGL